jgi:hypothetical protein
MTSTSILVRRKQSKASLGSHTTVSFSLNEVLNTRHSREIIIGLDQFVVPRIVVARYRLQPPETVDVGNCRNQRSFLLGSGKLAS